MAQHMSEYIDDPAEIEVVVAGFWHFGRMTASIAEPVADGALGAAQDEDLAPHSEVVPAPDPADTSEHAGSFDYVVSVTGRRGNGHSTDAGWLSVGFALFRGLGGLPRDYLLPMPNADFTVRARVRAWAKAASWFSAWGLDGFPRGEPGLVAFLQYLELRAHEPSLGQCRPRWLRP